MEKIKTESHEEWLALRKNSIGGSDAASIVGLNPFGSPYALWAEKTGKVPSFEGNLRTEVGTYLEEFVAQKWAEATGKKVRKCNLTIKNPDYPFAHANIDRDVVGENAGLECKTTSELNVKSFRNGDFPAQYYAQCMHYLAVTGYERWHLAVLIGNREFKTFVIERDEDEIKALMSAEKEFWKYVETNTAPPADGSSATTEAIKTIFTDSRPGTVDLFGMEGLLEQRAMLQAQEKEIDARIDEIDNQIKTAMGDSEKATAGSYRISWASSTRKSFDTKAFTSAHKDIDLSPFYKTSSYRTFKITAAN